MENKKREHIDHQYEFIKRKDELLCAKKKKNCKHSGKIAIICISCGTHLEGTLSLPQVARVEFI